MKNCWFLPVVLQVVVFSGCSVQPKFADSKDHTDFVYNLSIPREYPVRQPVYRINNLTQALSDPNPVARRNAVKDLSVLAKTERSAVEGLKQALASTDPAVRMEAACALAKSTGRPDAQLVAALVEAGETGTSAQRHCALEALSVCVSNDPGILPAYQRVAGQVKTAQSESHWKVAYVEYQRASDGGPGGAAARQARLARQRTEAAAVAARVEQKIIKEYGSLEAYRKARAEAKR